MTTLANRPVFDFDVDWSSVPRKQFSYDLNERTLGYALPRYERLQSHTTQGFSFQMLLESEAAIVAWDAFTAELKGRLGGFWCPSPFGALEIEPDVAANDQFLIKDQNLRAYYTDHPSTHLAAGEGEEARQCAYLAFSRPGHATQYGQIKLTGGVTATLDGRERVLLETPLPEAVDETWHCTKLLYVRLATDTEAGEFYGEGKQIRTVRVLELPLEYAEIETGQMPVYLYEFWHATDTDPVVWRLTGLNEDIASNGETFTSAAIEHGEWVRSMRDSAGIEIRGWNEPSNPLSMFVPFKVPTSLWLTVYETTYGTPNVRSTVFTGKVLSVKPQGQYLVAKCASFGDVFGRRFPRFYLQPRCNYFVYDQNCRATVRECGANITYISGRQVKITFLLSPPFPGRPESADFNFFALGYCYTGTGETFELRSIRQSQLNGLVLTLKVDRAFEQAHVGSLLQVVPGCDGSATQCSQKFYNFVRFGGHPNVPGANPSVVGLTPATPSGNKK